MILDRIREIISVVSYGDEILLTGKIFTFSLSHVDHDPSEWYQLLLNRNCKKLRLLFEPSDNLCSYGIMGFSCWNGYMEGLEFSKAY